MRLKTKSFSFRIIFTTMVLSMLAIGCGGGGTTKAENIELTIWKPYVDSDYMRPLIEEYEKTHKNVRITVVNPEGSDYESQLLNSLAADSGPDIFSINNAQLPTYLDKIVAAPDSVWKYVDFKNAFVDTITRDFTKDTKIYGAALSVDTLALYYNKSMLPAAGVYTVPKTWRELEVAVRKLSQSDSRGYFRQSGIALGLSSQAPGGRINRGEDILYLFMLQQGATPWNADLSSPAFADDVDKGGSSINPATTALHFYTSFADPNNNNYTWNTRSDYSIDAFVNRRAAMMINYSYVRDTIKQKNATLDFDVASVPQPNVTDPAVNFANYYGEVVSKKSKHPEAAWDFLKFITQHDQLAKFYAQNKVPSSRKDLIADQVSDPEIGVFADAGGSAKSFTRPQSAKVDSIFSKAIDSVILQGSSVEDAISEARSQADSISRPGN